MTKIPEVGDIWSWCGRPVLLLSFLHKDDRGYKFMGLLLTMNKKYPMRVNTDPISGWEYLA